MKNNQFKKPECICTLTTIIMSTTLHAGIAPIDITLSSEAGSNNINISPGETAVAEYKIQDVIGRPPLRTWQWTSAFVPYIQRVNSLHQPDCSVYNQQSSNPNSFALPEAGFCYFAFQVDGSAFSQQSQTATYRPIFSNSNAIGYGPCDSDSLHINLNPRALFPLIAGGSYYDIDGIRRPLLVASQDSGKTWAYPNSIPTIPSDITFEINGAIYGTACTGNTCIAAGKGEDTSGIFGISNIPILAVSQNAGRTWNYVINASFPEFTPPTASAYEEGLFNAASCSTAICIAVGQYRDSTFRAYPLLIQSQNSAVTWVFPESITSPDFNGNPYSAAGELLGASCSGGLCVTVGSYVSGDNKLRPLLAESQDAGTNWSYPENITSPEFTPGLPAFNDSGILRGVSCYGNICTAVGSYNDTTKTYPLLAVTQNYGASWIYEGSVVMPALDPAFNFGAFISSSCYGARCVAVGYYFDDLFIIRPLLAVSNDSASTWSFSSEVSTPEFTPNNTDSPFLRGYFNDVSCNANVCVAVGAYEYPLGIFHPLLAQSTNGGASWVFPSSVTNPEFTPFNAYPFSRGSFGKVSCNDAICIATGTYIDNNIPGLGHSLLAITYDFGMTWSFPTSVTETSFSPESTYPYADGAVLNTATAGSAALIPDKLKFIYPNFGTDARLSGI